MFIDHPTIDNQKFGAAEFDSNQLCYLQHVLVPEMTKKCGDVWNFTMDCRAFPSESANCIDAPTKLTTTIPPTTTVTRKPGAISLTSSPPECVPVVFRYHQF